MEKLQVVVVLGVLLGVRVAVRVLSVVEVLISTEGTPHVLKGAVHASWA